MPNWCYLFNAMAFLFSGTVWILNFVLGKMEWPSIIVGILFLTAGAINLIAYIRAKRKSKDMGEENG